MEYLTWGEDLGAEIILGVWAGLALGPGNPVVPQAQLQPYIDDVIDQLHFLLDPVTTKLGALRSKYGHPDPYKIAYVEMYASFQFYGHPISGTDFDMC